MFHTKTYEIKSTDDIELNIKRDSLLEFKVSFDDEKPMKALFFFIAGIRSADYAGYEEHLAEFVVKEFEVAVIRVDYHCIGFRPQTGATLYMDKRDKEIFIEMCQKLEKRFNTSIGIGENLLSDELLNHNETLELCGTLDTIIATLKSQNRAPKDFAMPISLSLQPTKDEYNNFGIMQALDILNALCFVKKNPPFKLAKDYKILLFGTSHGGYLALLCAKFAPWLIDAVVENSGYANAPFRLLGFGKYIDWLNIKEVILNASENLVFVLSTKTHFNRDESSPNCYTEAHDKIRSLPELDHLQIQSTHHKPIYVSYHSAKDSTIALPEPKQRLYAMFEKLGYNATLHMIKDESEVDGKFIKNLEHGMNMSLKTLIQKELPPLLARKFTHEKKEKHEIIYPSENLEYHFKESAGGGGFELKVRKLS